MHAQLLRMVAIISGHVFLGPELCRREEYLGVAVAFTRDIVRAVPAMKRWPRWLKPAAARWLEPSVAKLREHRARMRAFLGPVIEARRAAKAARGRGDGDGDGDGDDTDEKEKMPEDTLQWMLDRTDDAGVTDLAELTNMQLLLTMAAIHTTTLTATFM